jgi:hypothetical protein
MYMYFGSGQARPKLYFVSLNFSGFIPGQAARRISNKWNYNACACIFFFVDNLFHNEIEKPDKISEKKIQVKFIYTLLYIKVQSENTKKLSGKIQNQSFDGT